MVEIAIAQPNELNLINDFYTSINYGGDLVTSDEEVVVAKDTGIIIGAVRLKSECGIKLLRGMQIKEGYQRQGLGTQMLMILKKLIGSDECYCLPHSYLNNFYSRIGFKEIDFKLAPQFLQDRVNKYKNEYNYNLIIMKT